MKIEEIIKREDMIENIIYVYLREPDIWEVKYKEFSHCFGYAFAPLKSMMSLEVGKYHCIKTAQRSLNLLNKVGIEKYLEIMEHIDAGSVPIEELNLIESIPNEKYPIIDLTIL